MRCLDILVIFRMDIGQISFNLVENALATRMLALLATCVAFCDILARRAHFLDEKRKVFTLFDF